MRQLAAGIAAAGLLIPAAALAQYPAKPIRVVVPYPPGGVDVSIRLMQNAMSDDLGQPIVIENRPGANTAIGSTLVARAAPDGYTLLATSTALVTGAVIGTVPLDPIKDFTPVSMVYTSMGVLAARPSVPFNSVTELIDYARRNPGKVSYASIGIGSEQHLTGEMLKFAAGMDLNHIPYKGFGPILQALLGQEVDTAFITYQTIRPLLTSGKAKALAVYSLRRRHPGMPNVADIAETVPGFSTTRSWVGLLGPAALPRPVLARLNGAAVKAINAASVRSQLEELGFIVVASTPEGFAEWIKADFETAAKLVKDVTATGVKFE
jgi:tripartite-type tricarboxylate transporter receptor subunit TctC